MTRIVLKNGEVIDTNTTIFDVCNYISICDNRNENKIYLFNIELGAEVIDINEIKSIETI